MLSECGTIFFAVVSALGESTREIRKPEEQQRFVIHYKRILGEE